MSHRIGKFSNNHGCNSCITQHPFILLSIFFFSNEVLIVLTSIYHTIYIKTFHRNTEPMVWLVFVSIHAMGIFGNHLVGLVIVMIISLVVIISLVIIITLRFGCFLFAPPIYLHS